MSELVECPNGCMLSAGLGYSPVVTRTFDWYTGDEGERNYCENCGAELVDVEPEDYARAEA